MINQFEKGLSISYCCKKMVESPLVGIVGDPFGLFGADFH